LRPPVITGIRSVYTTNQVFENGCGAAIGQMKASSEEMRIGLVAENRTPGIVVIFDFDYYACKLSNMIQLRPLGADYGMEFFWDNSKFYVQSREVYLSKTYLNMIMRLSMFQKL
jgi:hypothetical protein